LIIDFISSSVVPDETKQQLKSLLESCLTRYVLLRPLSFGKMYGQTFYLFIYLFIYFNLVSVELLTVDSLHISCDIHVLSFLI